MDKFVIDVTIGFSRITSEKDLPIKAEVLENFV